MRDNGNTGPALGSEAVGAQFWALICDDEEWLRTEFDGVVSEPAEHPTGPPPATVFAVDRDRRARFGLGTIRAGWTRLWINHRTCPDRVSGHQRSPPGAVTTM